MYEKIKEWIEACKAGELMTQSDAWEVIDALLNMTKQLQIQYDNYYTNCQYMETKLATVIEALNFIASICEENQPAEELLTDISMEVKTVLKNLCPICRV